MSKYEGKSYEELDAVKQSLLSERADLDQKIAEISIMMRDMEMKQNFAKQYDSMSPEEREVLQQYLAAKSVESGEEFGEI